MVFDHVVISVSDYARSKAFFLGALKPLGVTVAAESPLGVELCGPDGGPSLCIRLTPEAQPTHLHLAFLAQTRQQVVAFYEAEELLEGFGSRECVHSITRTTIRRSCSARMDTTSKRSAMRSTHEDIEPGGLASCSVLRSFGCSSRHS